MDIATIIGLVMAFGCIIGGAIIEGVHISALIQPTAAMIVGGGDIRSRVRFYAASGDH